MVEVEKENKWRWERREKTDGVGDGQLANFSARLQKQKRRK